MIFHLELIDVKAAFLEANMSTRTSIKFPDGLVKLGLIMEQECRTHWIELLKMMYGNVDAMLIFSEHTKNLNGEQKQFNGTFGIE